MTVPYSIRDVLVPSGLGAAPALTIVTGEEDNSAVNHQCNN